MDRREREARVLRQVRDHVHDVVDRHALVRARALLRVVAAAPADGAVGAEGVLEGLALNGAALEGPAEGLAADRIALHGVPPVDSLRCKRGSRTGYAVI